MEKEVIRFDVLSREELGMLFREYYNGNMAAREKIILHNTALVGYCIKRKYSTFQRYYDDLFQAGMIGLIKAVDTYCLDLNYSFSTYATYYILAAMQEFLRKEKRLSMLSIEEFPVEVARYDMEDKLIKKLDDKRIVDNLLSMLSPQKRRVVELYYLGDYTLEEVGKIMGIGSRTVWHYAYKSLIKIRCKIDNDKASE